MTHPRLPAVHAIPSAAARFQAGTMPPSVLSYHISSSTSRLSGVAVFGCMSSRPCQASLADCIPSVPTHKHAQIGYLVVSVLFISSAVGYFIAGALNNRLTDRFGMGAVSGTSVSQGSHGQRALSRCEVARLD